MCQLLVTLPKMSKAQQDLTYLLKCVKQIRSIAIVNYIVLQLAKSLNHLMSDCTRNMLLIVGTQLGIVLSLVDILKVELAKKINPSPQQQLGAQPTFIF